MSSVKTELQLVCDFVNTLDREEGRDELVDAAGLGVWLRARGLWGRRPTDDDAERARALREALRELMRANNGVSVDTAAAAATLEAEARRTGIAFRFDDGAIRLFAPAAGIGAVVAAAGEAMVDGSWPRLKACRADSCRWAFVDRARNRSRKWCSMSVCGNREKARAFRTRHGGPGAASRPAS